MNVRSTLALSLAALASGTILAPTAGAATTTPAPQMGVRWHVPAGMQLDGCTVTAQPWMGEYNLSLQHTDGSIEVLIDGEQHDRFEVAPQSFNFAVGDVDYVLWARTNHTAPATDHSSWGDALKVSADSCQWADGVTYGAMPGKRDSVVLSSILTPVPSTTTSTTPAPTSTVPEPTTTTSTVTLLTTVPVPEVTPPSITVDVVTPIPSPRVGEPTVEAPTTTLLVDAQLPVTGAGTEAWILGGGTVGAGLLALAAERIIARIRRARA